MPERLLYNKVYIAYVKIKEERIWKKEQYILQMICVKLLLI